MAPACVHKLNLCEHSHKIRQQGRLLNGTWKDLGPSFSWSCTNDRIYKEKLLVFNVSSPISVRTTIAWQPKEKSQASALNLEE